MARRAVLLALAALLLAPAAAPVASACATLGALDSTVPCGRVYPIITLVSDAPAPMPLAHNKTVTVEGKMIFEFRAVGDGYSPVAPTDPIKVTFEFPRKPAWVDMKVEPDTIVVDVNDPTKFTPDPEASGGPEVYYRFEAPFKTSLTLTGQAVLRDGIDYAKLLLFAKSSESGIYQSGYGIKEYRVAPEGALHEADVASLRDVFAATPLTTLALKGGSAKVAGTTITFTPPASVPVWQPAKFQAKIEPAPSGKVVAALHDEAGNLVFATQPLDASSGQVQFAATLAKPGLHTASFTLLPDATAGSATPPLTIPVEFLAGDVKAEGFAYPKDYLATDDGVVTAPSANTADPLTQFQRDLPLFVFDNAQSVTATVTLTTPGQDLGRGLASVNMLLLDPDGKVLQSASAEPTQLPQRSLRIGSVPAEGWYTIRVQGVGLPVESSWNVKAEVAYASAPQARNRADGVVDTTPAKLSQAGQNVTLPLDNLTLWAPSDFTPKFDKIAGAQYGLTVYGPNGTLVYASGLRNGKASLSAPLAGAYRAFVYAQPQGPGAPFSPLVRAFGFDVGANRTTTVQKFVLADAPEVPTSAQDAVVALYALPAGADAKVDVAGAQPNQALAGKTVEGAAGLKLLVVSGTNAGPANAASVKASVDLPAPVTLVGPAAAKLGDAPKGVPAPGLGVAFVAVAALALLARRRR